MNLNSLIFFFTIYVMWSQLPTWAKVVIGIVVVVAVLALIWLVIWLVGGSSYGSSISVVNPSEYTGSDAKVFNPPCTSANKCAPNYTVNTGVGWAIANMSSVDAEISVMGGHNCSTTAPNCAPSPQLGVVPAGKTMSWTDMNTPVPLAVDGILHFNTSAGNGSAYTPDTVNPATQYILVTLTDNSSGGAPIYTSELQNY